MRVLQRIFVTAHMDDIFNTDSNKQYSVTVIYNIHKYMVDKKVKRSGDVA